MGEVIRQEGELIYVDGEDVGQFVLKRGQVQSVALVKQSNGVRIGLVGDSVTLELASAEEAEAVYKSLVQAL